MDQKGSMRRAGGRRRSRHGIIQLLYLDLLVGEQLTATLGSHSSSGKYDHITGGRLLAETIASDLQSLSGDKHFKCLFGVHPAEPSKEEQLQRLQRLNYRFSDIKKMHSNISSVEICGFIPVQ